MSVARVILVPRPERDVTELYVVRSRGDGTRDAFTQAGEWERVAAGAEAPLLDSFEGAVGVNLHELRSWCERVTAKLRLDSL